MTKPRRARRPKIALTEVHSHRIEQIIRAALTACPILADKHDSDCPSVVGDEDEDCTCDCEKVERVVDDEAVRNCARTILFRLGELECGKT
jgi:hypothetical protein